jgi:hypothetical protein
MARSGLANVVGVSEGAVPEEALLGRAATFTLPDEERSGTKLLRAWAKHGLDVNDLPDARQPVHVFQSACASVKTRGRGPGSNGRRVEVTADEIEDNGVGCSYQITLKAWDRANKTIDHEKAMRVEFTKSDSSIKFVPLDAYDSRMGELEAQIRAHFDANAKTVPGQKIRNAVREQLLKIGAQNLRRKAGGLYFVPKAWQPRGKRGTEPTKPVLDALKGVLEELYEERADFYLIPLANDEEMQAMVRKHFTINVSDQAEEMTLRALNRVRTGKGARGVRQDLVDNMRADQRMLLGAVQQFDELVTLEKRSLTHSLADLEDALRKLEELANE